MALKQPIFGRAMYADADVTEGQLVKVTGDESVSPAVAGDNAVGVALSDAVAGDKFSVELFAKGILELESAGAVVAGDELSAAAESKVKTASAGEHVFGVALTGGNNAPVTLMVK